MKDILTSILKRLARDILAKQGPTIIAVTGNVGKTSTRTALVSFLEGFSPVGTNIDNYNSEWGVPLSLIGRRSPGRNLVGWIQVLWTGWMLTLTKQPDFPPVWVLELGIDKPGDMDYFIQDFLEFDIIIFNHVGKHPVHLANFTNRNELIREKAKVLRGLKKDGLLIINGDDPYIKHIYRKRTNVITFGFEDSVDIQASEFTSDIEVVDTQYQWRKYHTSLVPKGSFKVRYKGSVIPFNLQYLVGRHQVYAVLPAIALGIYDGINLVEIAQKIQDFTPVKGRMNFMEGIKDSLLIDDSYNSAPAAMMMAVETLININIPGVRKVVALGAMKEIGNESENVHYELGKKLALEIDLFIGVGDEMKTAIDAYRKYTKQGESHYFDTSKQAALWLKDQITSNDIVLVKGSQFSRMEHVSGELMSNKRFRKQLIPRQTEEWLSQ